MFSFAEGSNLDYAGTLQEATLRYPGLAWPGREEEWNGREGGIWCKALEDCRTKSRVGR